VVVLGCLVSCMIVQLICQVKYYQEKNTLIKRRSNISGMYVEVLMKLSF
jgi:hypothetical protein